MKDAIEFDMDTTYALKIMLQ